MAVADLFSVLLAVLFPLLANAAQSRRSIPEWCSSIVLCYGIGILVSNLRLWSVDESLMQAIAGGSMLIGLPLLLFAVKLRESFGYARRMLFPSFSAACRGYSAPRRLAFTSPRGSRMVGRSPVC